MNTLEYTLHEGQYRVITSPKRFIVAAAGIQGGKTTIGAIWSYKQMEANPKAAGLIISPTYDQLSQSTLVKFFSLFPEMEKYYKKKEKIIYLPTGGMVFCRSAEEVRHVEGLTLNWIWGDEADGFNTEAWYVLRGRVTATQGTILFTSSLYSNSWMSRELIMKPEMKDSVDLISWSSKDNPGFARSEYDLLKKTIDPILFDRMYDAKPTFMEGLIYPYFYDDDIVEDWYVKDASYHIQKRIFAVDYGAIDPTCVLIIDVTDHEFVIRHEFYRPSGDITDIRKFLDSHSGEARMDYGWDDPSQKTSHLELSRHYTMMDNQIKDILEGIYVVRSIQSQRKIKIHKSCINVIRELRGYMFKKSQLAFVEEAEDRNNHAMDPLRYAISSFGILFPNFFQRLDKNTIDDVSLTHSFWEKRKQKKTPNKLWKHML